MFEVFIFTNGLFLGVLLLIQRSELRKANLFLALFLISLSLEIAPDLFEEENFPIPETSFFTVPLLFLYAQQIIKGQIRWPQWLWLLPGLVVNIITLVMSVGEPSMLVIIILIIPFYAVNLFLLFKLKAQIALHQLQLKTQYTNLDARTLSWMRGLVLIFLIFNFVWILDDGLLLAEIDFPQLALLAEFLTLISVFWVGYYGMGQKGSSLTVPETSTKETPKQESVPDETEKKQFDEALSQLEDHKLYLNQELTLRMLAQQLDVNEKKLSAWINQYTESNFYQLINQYRVAEFKKQLAEPANRNFSLLGIAQNAGFRNKSTFYKVFKELEGITPNDYKKGLSGTE